MVDTVKMYREEPQHEGAPQTADVHPDEVENYRRGGWLTVQVVEAETPTEILPGDSLGVEVADKAPKGKKKDEGA